MDRGRDRQAEMGGNRGRERGGIEVETDRQREGGNRGRDGQAGRKCGSEQTHCLLQSVHMYPVRLSNCRSTKRSVCAVSQCLRERFMQ